MIEQKGEDAEVQVLKMVDHKGQAMGLNLELLRRTAWDSTDDDALGLEPRTTTNSITCTATGDKIEK